ncbi:MAG: hypothetical protein SF029_17705 [bacterium]|nr:hypothetical protein [bacterium]
MGIEVVWDEQVENVIVYKFQAKWTWHEFLVAFYEHELPMAQFLDGQPYAVIGDLLNSQPLPPGSGITHVYGIFKKYPANHTLTMIVTPNSFVRTLLSVGMRVYPETRTAFASVDTLDEARNQIRQRFGQGQAASGD